ncbi:MAG: ABC transporter ATP-binding protein [Conexivisphaerales archaeon]
MIETDGLTKRFGDATAVENLTFRVEEGEVFGFLGPNGAGKTTTVRMLCCLISKTSGTARVGDYEVGGEEENLKIRKMVGFLPENVGLYDELSAYRNLDFFARLYECSDAQRMEGVERLLRMLGLWEKRDSPVGTFSKGMKQKIAIARALVHDPRVIFLDEPTANLDPESAKTVRDFILELKKEKRTILLNTHNLDEAQRVCDRIGVLRTSLLAVGSPQKLRESLWGRKTVIHLARVDDGMVSAVRGLGFTRIEAFDNKVIVDVDDGDVDNPKIVSAVVGAGGRVQYVTELRPTLEDIYLKLVGG